MPDIRSGGPPRDWLRQAGEIEATCRSTSVGGLAHDFGLFTSGPPNVQPVFGRLVEYARRRRRLTLERLAEEANVDLAQIVQIETEDKFVPDTRTVYQLSQVLKLPSRRLMELAGLTTPKPETSRAALRFAARSEPTGKLSREEREAFEEFVRVLVESSDEG